MFNSKAYLIIVLVSLSVLCFSNQIDPMTGSKTGLMKSPVCNENYPIEVSGSRDLTPPEFTVSHTENGDVTINVSSDEDLFTGWSDEKLIWSVANFDYWWLNTRLAIDTQNNIYAAVKLYEYSNPSNNFDMFELHNNGEIETENNNWNGPNGISLIINNPDKNIFLAKPTCDYEGVVDETNITHIISTGGGSNIQYKKIDADGNLLIDGTAITGANAWTNEARISVDSNDESFFNKIYIVWSKDMHDISYAYSEDGGNNWSERISLYYNASAQLNKPQVCCDSNNNVHIIWQYWDGGSNTLAYMKVRPDGTIAIDVSFLTQANNNIWSPLMDIDAENNLHIVWASSYNNVTSAYYTKINGNLDADGSSLTDGELTLIQEQAFLTNQIVRYPKCVTDDYLNVHTIYEFGEYGQHTAKSSYYKKRNSAPLLKIECPDNSVLFVEMTGNGTDWEGTFTPNENGIYNVRVSASDIDGNTGVDYYEFEYTGVIVDDNAIINNNFTLSNYPNPFNPTTTISFSVTQTSSFVTLEINNIKGQKVKTLVNEKMDAGTHHVMWDGKNENGKSVTSGIYFYKLKTQTITETRKMLLLK